MKYRYAALTCTILLSGCGINAIPETSDIKNNLLDQFGGCKYIKLSDVKKINGRDLGNGRYQVDQEFALEILPDSKFAAEYEQLMADKAAYKQIEQGVIDKHQAKRDALTAEIEKIKEERNKMADRHEKFMSSPSASADERAKAINDYLAADGENTRNMSQLDGEIGNISRNFLAEVEQAMVAAGYPPKADSEASGRYRQLLNKMITQFDSTCNHMTSDGKTMVLQVGGLEPGRQMEAFTKGAKMQFKGSVAYTKTENGWVR